MRWSKCCSALNLEDPNYTTNELQIQACRQERGARDVEFWCDRKEGTSLRESGGQVG